MNLQENIKRIKEVMGLLKEENPKDENWLVNWFSKVPQEKLDKTFGQFVYDYASSKFVKKPVDRNYLIKIIKETPILYLNDSDVPEMFRYILVGHAGMFTPYEDEKKLEQQVNDFFDENFTIEKLLKNKPKNESDLEKAKKTIDGFKKKFLEWKKKVNGKVTIFQDRRKDFTLSHELGHALYHATSNNINLIISKICGNSCGEIYISEKTEIYSFLLSFRGEIGLEAADVITKVNLEPVIQDDKGKLYNYLITLNVKRDNKDIVLPASGEYMMEAENPIHKVFQCCNGADKIQQVIMSLHNDLAYNQKSQNINRV